MIETLAGARRHDVRIEVTQAEGLRGLLVFDTPLGRPGIPAKLEDDEQRVAQCSPGDAYFVEQLLAALS